MNTIHALLLDNGLASIGHAQTTSSPEKKLEVYQNHYSPVIIPLLINDASTHQRYLQLRVEEL